MQTEKETATAANSEGTILKPFHIEGGRFIIEAEISNLEHVLLSIRGAVDSKNISDMFQTAEVFLEKIINNGTKSAK